MTLFIAFTLVIVAICALGLNGRSLRLSAALVAASLAVSYWGGSELLGRPKPARLALLERQADEVTVVSFHYIEDVAIWLWLIMPGEVAPRAYSLPWSLEDAKNLREAGRKADSNGTGVKMRTPFEAEGDHVFYADPRPPMPAKEG